MYDLNMAVDFHIADGVLDEILSTEDISEIVMESKLPGLGSVVRKHVCGVIKCYLEVVEDSAPIQIRNETGFSIKLASIGLHLGMTSTRDTTSLSYAFDSNVALMAVVTFALVALVVMKPK
jgi:hypothetical protein